MSDDWDLSNLDWSECADMFSSLTNSVGSTGADLTVESLRAAQDAYQARRDTFDDNYARVLNQTLERVMATYGLTREAAGEWLNQRLADEIAFAAARIAIRPRPLTGRQRTRRLWRKRGRR